MLYSRLVAGELFWITTFVESKKTAFAVARLGMYTGLAMRSFGENCEHEPLEIGRVAAGLRKVLDTADLAELDVYLTEHLGSPLRLYDSSQ